MARSIINVFSNNLLIYTPFSLIIIKFNLINNVSNGLAPIKFS